MPSITPELTRNFTDEFYFMSIRPCLGVMLNHPLVRLRIKKAGNLPLKFLYLRRRVIKNF